MLERKVSQNWIFQKNYSCCINLKHITEKLHHYDAIGPWWMSFQYAGLIVMKSLCFLPSHFTHYKNCFLIQFLLPSLLTYIYFLSQVFSPSFLGLHHGMKWKPCQIWILTHTDYDHWSCFSDGVFIAEFMPSLLLCSGLPEAFIKIVLYMKKNVI
jgi:hypothetical protein